MITFEEAWPLACTLELDRADQSKIFALTAVSASTKQKDAASLGALSYAFHEADNSVERFVADAWPMRVLAAALDKPQEFFDWLDSELKTERARSVALNAKKYLAAATWGWDKACILAAAFLSSRSEPPSLLQAAIDRTLDFPFWVALDKHTPQGKAAIKAICIDKRLSYRQVIWAGFYHESAHVNAMAASPWWNAETRWRLAKAGLSIDDAASLWIRVKPFLIERLNSEAAALRAEVLGTDARQRDLLTVDGNPVGGRVT